MIDTLRIVSRFVTSGGVTASLPASTTNSGTRSTGTLETGSSRASTAMRCCRCTPGICAVPLYSTCSSEVRKSPSTAIASTAVQSRAPAAIATGPPRSCPHANTTRPPPRAFANRIAPRASFTQRDANTRCASVSASPGPPGPKSR